MKHVKKLPTQTKSDRDDTAGQGVSRRDMLRLGGIGSVAAITSSLIGCGCDTPAPSDVKKKTTAASTRGRRPRNVIFMVSDGMSTGVPSLADPFAEQTRGRQTNWSRLMRDGDAKHGQLSTRSLNSLVTDSAAASSAWGSGSRVNNGALNVLPDGTKLVPLATLLVNHGKRVGLVTTDVMPGATPAGFAAVSPSRHAYEDIATQLQGSVDVLMGGGLRYFDPLARTDQLDLLGSYQKDDYQLLTERKAVLGRPSSRETRVLGLFADMQMPYTIDHLQSAKLRKSTPTLAEMTRFALQSLDMKRDGFFIMIEGARIDHACHANDAATMMWEQLAFDDAVGEAMSFIENRDDTLLVVTSDHGNANPGLCGMGSAYSESTACFEKLAKARASFTATHHELEQLAKQQDLHRLAKTIEATFGVKLHDDEIKQVGKALADNKLEGEIWQQERTWFGALSQALANHTGMSFNGRTHTADQVILSATGPGAQAFNGLHEHPEVFAILTDLFGVDYVNPSAEATNVAATAKTPA